MKREGLRTVGWVLLITLPITLGGFLMFAFLYPKEHVVEPPPLLYVRWPTELANGWEVQWEYNGLYASSLHATKEEALRLYAVLAGRIVEK